MSPRVTKRITPRHEPTRVLSLRSCRSEKLLVAHRALYATVQPKVDRQQLDAEEPAQQLNVAGEPVITASSREKNRSCRALESSIQTLLECLPDSLEDAVQSLVGASFLTEKFEMCFVGCTEQGPTIQIIVILGPAPIPYRLRDLAASTAGSANNKHSKDFPRVVVVQTRLLFARSSFDPRFAQPPASDSRTAI